MFNARPLMTATVMITKRYVISRTGTVSVLYLITPNMAKRPRVRPICSLTLSIRKMRRNMADAKVRKVMQYSFLPFFFL